MNDIEWQFQSSQILLLYLLEVLAEITNYNLLLIRQNREGVDISGHLPLCNRVSSQTFIENKLGLSWAQLKIG